MYKRNEKRVVEQLIQDMRVRARDMDNFLEARKYKKIIEKFEKGAESEFDKSKKKKDPITRIPE